jgi:hypothetical protein
MISNERMSLPRTWIFAVAVLAVSIGGFILIDLATQSSLLSAFAVADFLAVVLLYIILRKRRGSDPMKIEQDMSLVFASLAESFKEKVGNQKRHNYFIARKRCQAAVRAVATAKREAMTLYIARLKEAQAMVEAGSYDAATVIFEELTATAKSNREPAFDAVAMYSLLGRLQNQRAARKNKKRT